jgi:cytoskeletal protein RodZ
MLFPNDPTTLEPLDFADAYRPDGAEVVTLPDGRQAIPLLLVIDAHVGKAYAAGEFPAILYMTDGVRNRAHIITDAPAPAEATATSEPAPQASAEASAEPHVAPAPEPAVAPTPEPVASDAPVVAAPVSVPADAPAKPAAKPSAKPAADAPASPVQA